MNREEYEHYQAQAALQREQVEAQTNMYAPQIFEQQQQQQAILVEQTNPSKVVDNIMLRLRGLQMRMDGSVVKVGEPKINQKGYENLWFILDSHVNQNIILSHLDEQNIANIMMSLSDDLVDDLALNWKDYGITKKTDLDVINNSILVNIFVALKRAEGQNEKNWLGKIAIENISGGVKMPTPKKDSWLSKFKL